MFSQNVLYHGSDEPNPARTELRAGSLTLEFTDGDLRYIKLGHREILRRVYVALRDANWNTIPAIFTNVRMRREENAFHIVYDARHVTADIDFSWHAVIDGHVDGTICFAMEGEALSTFMRNRLGFCVLHPMLECAGQPCLIEKVDGSRQEGVFPRYISPHQPFTDIRAIYHQVLPGVRSTVRFEGDTFEMEDQRNWTDASYKTYSTPLCLPFPARVEKGSRIQQKITLSIEGNPPYLGACSSDIGATLHMGTSPAGRLPSIGLGVASHGEPLSDRQVARLRRLHPSHLRLDLDLTTGGYASALEWATDQVRTLGIALEVALTLSDEADQELTRFREMLERVAPPVCRWLILHAREKSTPPHLARLAARYLSRQDPGAKIAIGTNLYFTELNRNRPALDAADLVCYSLNPQVHAFDNLSLVETLETQGVTVDSARQFCGKTPIVVSPITLKPRFNPNATQPDANPAPGELPQHVDPRQMSLLGAGWTLGSLKHLAQSGVHSATYYETTGWRGLLETDGGSPSGRFRSLPGSAFPLYHVFALVGEYAEGNVIPVTASSPLQVEGIALEKNGLLRVVIANLTEQSQLVEIRNLPLQVRIRHMDETNVVDAMLRPRAFLAQEPEATESVGGMFRLSLLPYALAWIDASCDKSQPNAHPTPFQWLAS